MIMSAGARRVRTAPRAVAAGLRRTLARTPLRVKLVATLLLLVVAALVGSGAAAIATMSSYLVGRVDTQLSSVADHPFDSRSTGISPSSAPHEADGGGGGEPRLPSAFVVEVTNSRGRVVYGAHDLVDSSQSLPRFPHVTAEQLHDDETQFFTVGAVGGGGQWRVLAKPVTLPNGKVGTLLVAQSLGDVRGTLERLTLLLVVIGAGAVAILAGVGYVVVRASLRPLREVERTAAKIAAGDLSSRVPVADPRTEVGQLSGALNTMLGEIEAAFVARAASEEAARRSERSMRHSEAAARRSEERMRRFVADASHELRTPLTSIRGFAELYRHGAAGDPDDVARLMRRIENEAKRMGLLVDDLLLLARLDQERPLAELPVDLLALAGDAVHDAQAVDPERPITLEVGATDPPPVVIGDEARLRQVLGNLLSNALRHTPPGTPVAVGVGTGISERTGLPVVTITVADQGPGMSSEEAARVFERFFRADLARNRSNGSTGLGLAIVAALVAGHGGHVDVETAPGAGACFRIELPLAGAPAPAEPSPTSPERSEH